jgi:hypothetical protein
MSQTKSIETIQGENWNGCIPVLLTLAPKSLSSPTLPPPIHVLLSRQTFLHVGLQSAVERLHKFAPTTLSFASGMVQNEPDPGSYDDNSNSNEDSKSVHEQTKTKTKTYPVCWFEDEATQIALRWHLFVGVLFDMKRERDIPWRIRLHFTSYPSSQILPLSAGQVQTQVQQFFKNSLKQALCLEYGNSKAALNVTKESHGRLWEAISTANFKLYQQVNKDLALQNNLSLLPVRLYVNTRPPIQRSIRDETRTLGSLLTEWLPDYFVAEEPAETVVSWRISGLQLPLDTILIDTWTQLCHADHFVYIILITN